ncbi:hypothetical protein ES703_111737 [subsurface metagenome]
MPSGVYSVVGEVYDVTTGVLITAITLPGRLSIREIAPPVVPPLPPPPVVPEVPTIDILGTPSLNLPRQLNVGDVWSGSVSLPTFGTVPFFGEARLLLRDPTGLEYVVAQGGRTLYPGETLQVPVNYNTSGFTGGNYTILMRVFDQLGNQIAEFPMGFLTMIEAIAPPLPPAPPVPEIPTAPTLPTVDMFQIMPSVNLPTEVEIGELWSGNISIPTQVPFALQALPSLPSYPVNAGLQLQSPIGQLFNVGTFQRIFTPGQTISLPVNFDTSILPQEGIHNLILNISDLQGNPLFSNVIGSLRALMPEVPLPAPPAPPALPRADIADIDFHLLTTGLLDPGDTVSWIMTGVYKGRAQSGSLVISLGTGPVGTFFTQFTLPPTPVNFNESYDWQDFSFRGSFTIPPNVELGQTYSVRARLEAFLEPTQETDTDWGVITITTPPAIPPSQFSNIRCTPMISTVRRGNPFTIFVYHTHVGASQDVRVYASIGKVGILGFDEKAVSWKIITVPDDTQPLERVEAIDVPTAGLSPGTYSIYAKLEHPWWGEVHSPVVEDVVTILPR